MEEIQFILVLQKVIIYNIKMIYLVECSILKKKKEDFIQKKKRTNFVLCHFCLLIIFFRNILNSHITKHINK